MKLNFYVANQEKPIKGETCVPMASFRGKDTWENMNKYTFTPKIRQSLEKHLHGDGMRLLRVNIGGDDDAQLALAMVANTGDGDGVAEALKQLGSRPALDITSIGDVSMLAAAEPSCDDAFFYAVEDGKCVGSLSRGGRPGLLSDRIGSLHVQISKSLRLVHAPRTAAHYRSVSSTPCAKNHFAAPGHRAAPGSAAPHHSQFPKSGALREINYSSQLRRQHAFTHTELQSTRFRSSSHRAPRAERHALRSGDPQGALY